MIIRACRHCPFFQELPLSGLLKFLGPVKHGACGYMAADDSLVVVELGLRPGPERDVTMARLKARLEIPDRDLIPDECPLHKRDITVSLGH